MNRIAKLSMSQRELERYCVSHDIYLRGCATIWEQTRPVVGAVVVGAVVGALFAGLVGATVGAGIMGWCWFGCSEFKLGDVVVAFQHARGHCNEWKCVDDQLLSVDRGRQEQYLAKAEEEWRRFYKLKTLSSIDTLDGREFEAAIAGLYESKGYTVKLTKASGDYGVDVVANRGEEILAIQAKRYSGKVGVKAVQEVTAGAYYYKATKAVVVTNSFFTSQAKELARDIGVVLINKKQLANMWEKVHPEAEVPKFNFEEYEDKKREIKKELNRIEVASGRKYDKRYSK